ncbi:hypothetical protein FN846DRAFT_893632 [Sphaerosporella brunnea]|uniref:Uncharacterized protein n=1 Tax=Sphaerosporella brunnea TaxID=1250544 RepID=A0A5J5ELE5_9PEZI|nr:hypothetical protein FN846DRAFT_893632 [Sphaerosporella brunnea]
MTLKAHHFVFPLLCSFLISSATAESWRGEENALADVERRDYKDIDPLYDFCTVMGDYLWSHGGYVGYDNGTKASVPNTYLRQIDLTKRFQLASRDAVPMKILPQPDAVPEISAGTLWGYNGMLYEIMGESEVANIVCVSGRAGE